MESMSYVSVAGGRVAVTRRGAGPALVFLHNAGTCQQIWTAQMNHYATSHTVVAFDFPGYGESDPATRDYTLDYCTDVAEQVIDELGLDDVVLIGNCIGAATALQLAARRPETVRAVLAINVLTAQTAEPGLLGPLAAIGVRWPFARRVAVSASAHLRPPRWLAKLYLRTQIADATHADPNVLEHLAQRWQQPRNASSLLRLHTDTFGAPQRVDPQLPVHLIWGQHNRILPSRGAAVVEQSLHPDRSRIIPGTGHLPMIEDPVTIITAIDDLLTCSPPDHQRDAQQTREPAARQLMREDLD
jgi:pimeloyl-ACP methyl ester carboxylesterase